MSYLNSGAYSVFFRAHNTVNQSGVALNQPFHLSVSEQCDIDTHEVVIRHGKAYVYGELKVTNTALVSFDADFSHSDSLVSQGWQCVNNLNLWQMLGDDGMYAVASENTGLIMKQKSTASGMSNAEETRIFGVRL